MEMRSYYFISHVVLSSISTNQDSTSCHWAMSLGKSAATLIQDWFQPENLWNYAIFTSFIRTLVPVPKDAHFIQVFPRVTVGWRGELIRSRVQSGGESWQLQPFLSREKNMGEFGQATRPDDGLHGTGGRNMVYFTDPWNVFFDLEKMVFCILKVQWWFLFLSPIIMLKCFWWDWKIYLLR